MIVLGLASPSPPICMASESYPVIQCHLKYIMLPDSSSNLGHVTDLFLIVGIMCYYLSYCMSLYLYSKLMKSRNYFDNLSSKHRTWNMIY